MAVPSGHFDGRRVFRNKIILWETLILIEAAKTATGDVSLRLSGGGVLAELPSVAALPAPVFGISATGRNGWRCHVAGANLMRRQSLWGA